MQEDNKIILDKEGYQEYKKSIDNLLVNLGRIEERMNIVKENGDPLNEYEELLTMKESLKERIKDKKNSLNKIVIVEKSNNEETLNIGDRVKIKTYYEDGTREEICELITTESMFDGDIIKVNINSPRGKILYGSTIGETKYLEIGKEKIKIDILEKIDMKTLKKVL